MKILVIAAALAAPLLFAAPASAASCLITIYYSDDSMGRPVGSWSNCPGQKGLQGRRTRFKETTKEELFTGPKRPGKLPCEFLERGCRPFERRP